MDAVKSTVDRRSSAVQPTGGCRIGRDELNLTEFPFALLASRAPKNAPLVMEFQDGEKQWTVTGDPRYGLPTSGDVEIYVVLMELTREQNFPVRVQFSRHDVIRRLGWDPGGQSYDRLQLGLDRLVGVTIRTVNAFWDAEQRGWVRRQAFHLLESYDILDSRHSRAPYPAPDGDAQSALSWFRWSPELYHNIHSGHIKSLDVGLFLSLKSSVSQALYRYLDAKRYDGKPQYRIGLRKLAWEHLGLSRNYFPSDIKRKLAPAHDELTEAGFLSGVEYAPMKSGEEMAVYRFPSRGNTLRDAGTTPALPEPGSVPVPVKAAAAAPGPAVPSRLKAEPLSELATALMAQGVSRAAAVQLSRNRPEECRLQLEYLEYRECRDRGAALVAAIRDGWAAPPAWGEAQRAQERKEKTQARVRQVQEETSQRQDTEAEFNSFWAALPAEQREAVEREARERLFQENRVLREFAQRRPNSSMVKDSLRPYLKLLSGWRSA